MRAGSIWNQKVSWRQTVAILGFLVLFIVLAASGLILVGVGLCVAWWLGSIVYVRAVRRRYPERVVRIQESTLLPWPCETVWTLIKPAEKAPLIEPTIRRGYRVPGTPEGLGEQQAFEYLDGNVSMIEVVEYQHAHRAVIRQVSPAPDVDLRMVQSLEPVAEGSIYTMCWEATIPAGRKLHPDVDRAWRLNMQAQMARIRLVLNETSGVAPLAADQSTDWPPPSSSS
jgi:uncharacterized protein YjeT (DUF2065 family)